MAYASTLPEVERGRYIKKLQVVYGSEDPKVLVDPYEVPDDKWVDDVSLWPPVEFGEIYTYLIDTPGQFTREKMKAYKSLEAFNYYISGWVHTILYCDLGPNCFLKAKVKASQRLQIHHQAWVGIVKSTGSVISGHCSCMAGCGEVCSHVAAVLFKVEACIRLKIASRTCTDLPCVWNQAFSKNVQASEAVDIHFFKPSKKRRLKEAAVESHEAEKQQRISIPDPKPKLSPTKIYADLYSCNPCAAVFSVLPGFSQGTSSNVTSDSLEEANLPIPLTDLYSPNNRSLSMTDLEQASADALNEIKVTDEEADFLQISTVMQSNCPTWHEYRKGRVTASNFYDVFRHMDSNSQVYPRSIICRIMQYYPNPDNVAALKWGRENEYKARTEYTATMSSKHQDFNVCHCGLFIDPKYPCLGASPDGSVSCSCCGKSILEIKCTFKYREHPPSSDVPLSDPMFFLQRDTTGEVHLSTSHKYYYQIQGQIAVCNVKFCDFVCWTPKGIFIERILRDNSFIDRIVPQLQLFFSRYLLPELLTHSLEPEPGSSTRTKKLHCVCQKPQSGKMIGCDNPDCKIEWFHYNCMGIKRAPKGKWYCSNCKKNN